MIFQKVLRATIFKVEGCTFGFLPFTSKTWPLLKKILKISSDSHITRGGRSAPPHKVRFVKKAIRNRVKILQVVKINYTLSFLEAIVSIVYMLTNYVPKKVSGTTTVPASVVGTIVIASVVPIRLVRTAVPASVVGTMVVTSVVPTRLVETAVQASVVETTAIARVVPTKFVEIAVPTIIVETAYYWKSCIPS